MYGNWEDVGSFANNPYFGLPTEGSYGESQGQTQGSGTGLGYFDWTDPSLGLGYGSNTDLPFYRNMGYSDDPGSSASFDPGKLDEFLASRGLSLRDRQIGPTGSGFGERALFDKLGKQVGNAQGYNLNQDPIESLAFTATRAFLNPFGELGAAGDLGQIGTSIGRGLQAYGQADVAGAADPLKAGLTAGLSGGLPSLGQYAGIENPGLRSLFDNSIKGGLQAGINGGNILQGAISAGLPSGLNYLGQNVGNLFGDEMPDVGTLGGTMQDAEGESSATLGGYVTPSQYESSIQAAGADKQVSAFDRVAKVLGLDSFAGSGFELPSINSGQIGDLAQGLAGLYGGYRQRKQAKELMGMIGGNRGAYEANLRRTLQRKDAASGRRSDYAGRETQLQAALAELDSRNAPAMAQLSGMKNKGLESMFKSALFTGDKLGWLRSSTPAPQMNFNLPSLASLPSLTSLSAPLPGNPTESFEELLKKLGG